MNTNLINYINIKNKSKMKTEDNQNKSKIKKGDGKNKIKMMKKETNEKNNTNRINK